MTLPQIVDAEHVPHHAMRKRRRESLRERVAVLVRNLERFEQRADDVHGGLDLAAGITAREVVLRACAYELRGVAVGGAVLRPERLEHLRDQGLQPATFILG